MSFEPGDWVWVHFQKIRFHDKAKSKLALRGDGPFLVLECLNDNAYVIDLPGEYNVSCTFNVADLSPYDFVEDDPNLRTNPFEEGDDDMTMGSKAEKHVSLDALKAIGMPMTRAMTRKKQEDLAVFIRKLLHDEESKMEHEEGAQVITLLKTGIGDEHHRSSESLGAQPATRWDCTGGPTLSSESLGAQLVTR